MNRKEIWQAVELELRKDKNRWPKHIAAQASIVNNRSGKLIDLALKMKYQSDKTEGTKKDFRKRIEAEAIAVAVASIRFIENLK